MKTPLNLFLIYLIIQLDSKVFAKSLVDEISESKIPEDGRLHFIGLAHKYGHSAEEIEVITEDGYILKIFHIRGKKRPILFLHGIGDTSNTWVLRGNKSLGLTLADEGHDLWFGNIRGNKYGRKHTKLDPDTDPEFWDFSFHEVGYYDWPAMIDRVLEETNETSINLVAHSQGSTSFFVLMSSKPEYNKKVNLHIGLAPVAFLDHVGLVLAGLIKLGPVLKILEPLGINEIFSDHRAEKQLLKLFCTQGYLTENICQQGIFFPIGGYDRDGIKPDFLSVIIGQYPAGASRKTLEHYAQVGNSGRFAKFDYGLLKNMVLYNSEKPQEYDFNKVTAKMALMYGEGDLIADPKDVLHLADVLPNVVYVKAIEKKKWNHVDFLWSSEMDKYFFPHMRELLDKYK